MRLHPPNRPTARSRWRSRLRTTLAGPALVFGLSACSPVYVARAGFEEAKILARRRPITAVIADPKTSPRTRQKLRLVLSARTYAARVIGLRAGESFTTYSWVAHDTLLLVLQAAPRLAFREHTWWFPIVGNVPYKGYFDFAAAHAAARSLERRGYDTYVRPSSAFSTLGWFNDPLLNTTLRYDEVILANTVIHELTHNTIYVPSQIDFNESLANFMGDHGAIDYFCSVDGQSSRRCVLARGVWHDDVIFGRFLTDLIARLKAVYARTDLPAATRLSMRDSVFQDARARWNSQVEPTLATNEFRGWGRRPTLNNASLIAQFIYYDRLDLFDAAYRHAGSDLRTFIHQVVHAATGQKDAYAAIAGLAGTARPRRESAPGAPATPGKSLTPAGQKRPASRALP